MNTISPILNRQLNPRHEVDIFIFCGFSECLKFITIKLVVVGNNADSDLCLLQCADVSCHEILSGIRVFNSLSFRVCR